jgi:DNA-binding NarL/FixJ family response regulator
MPYNPLKVLTIREAMVFEARLRGLTLKEVAGELNLSYHTVRHHVESIHKKLSVHSLQQSILAFQATHCRHCRKGIIARFKLLRRLE